MVREIGRFEADLPEDLWHLAQEIERDAIGFLKVNPETVERNESMIGESAASSRSGGFVSITDSVFGQRNCASREAGNFGHSISRFPASDTFLSRYILPPYCGSPEPFTTIAFAGLSPGQFPIDSFRDDKGDLLRWAKVRTR